MKTDPHMSLRIWDELLDLYSHEQLADNWAKVGAHNHTNGQGVPIPVGGIETGVLYGLWESLTLGAKVLETTPQSPGARFEIGNSVVRLRGVLKSSSSISAGEELFTLPTSLRPSFGVYIKITNQKSSSYVSNLASVAANTGVVSLTGETVESSKLIYLDGITFNFS